MTHVKVEEDITLMNDVTGQPIMSRNNEDELVPEVHSHFHFLCLLVLPDPKMGEGKKGAKTVKRLKKAFKDAKPGEWVALDDEDCEAVLRVLESPTNKWNHIITSQLLPFMEAFEKENRDKQK